jgi:hypothetical protein
MHDVIIGSPMNGTRAFLAFDFPAKISIYNGGLSDYIDVISHKVPIEIIEQIYEGKGGKPPMIFFHTVEESHYMHYEFVSGKVTFKFYSAMF